MTLRDVGVTSDPYRLAVLSPRAFFRKGHTTLVVADAAPLWKNLITKFRSCGALGHTSYPFYRPPKVITSSIGSRQEALWHTAPQLHSIGMSHPYLSLGYVNDVSDVTSMQVWVQLILPFDG